LLCGGRASREGKRMFEKKTTRNRTPGAEEEKEGSLERRWKNYAGRGKKKNRLEKRKT